MAAPACVHTVILSYSNELRGLLGLRLVAADTGQEAGTKDEQEIAGAVRIAVGSGLVPELLAVQELLPALGLLQLCLVLATAGGRGGGEGPRYTV